MNSSYTKAFSVLLLLFSSLFLYSCSSHAQENISKKSEIDNRDDDEKEFTFHQNKNGKDNIWKAVFKDGELTELYKNGQKIPAENLEDYSDMVNEEMEGVHHHGFGRNSFHFNFDPGDFEHPGENFGDWNFETGDPLFNNEEFHHDMDSLRSDMKKMHGMKFKFHFDTSAFNKGMRELSKSLRHIRVNPHICFDKDNFPGFDMEAFKDNMRNFGDEMKHNRIFDEDFKMDMSELDNNMKNFDKNMKYFDLHMKELSKNMKKLKEFLKDMKHELIKDNLIKDEDEDFSMKFNSHELLINGKKVSDEQLNKYKAIYKNHYGKDIDDEFDINNNGRDDDDNE